MISFLPEKEMVAVLGGLRTYFTTEDEGMDHVSIGNIPGSFYFGLHILFFIAYRNHKLRHNI